MTVTCLLVVMGARQGDDDDDPFLMSSSPLSNIRSSNLLQSDIVQLKERLRTVQVYLFSPFSLP